MAGELNRGDFMALIARTIFVLAAVAGSVLCIAPASAQATRTWISGVGDDVNPCSRTAPCKTFQGAFPKTAAGGEINCLDPGGVGALSITKAIQIICDNTQSGVLVAATTGITINVPAGTYVTLSGLYLDGLGSTGVAGTNGVNIVQSGNITLRNMTINGFRNGFGVNFVPSQNASLVMNNVAVVESGSGNVGTGGVFIPPTAGITATVTIANSRIQNNSTIGLRAATVGIVGSVINATIDGSVISDNPTGLLAKAPAGTGTIKLILSRSTLNNSSGYGITVNGTGTTVRVGDSVISNNGTGLLVNGGAALNSFGTNMLAGNGTDGAFSALVPLK